MPLEEEVSVSCKGRNEEERERELRDNRYLKPSTLRVGSACTSFDMSSPPLPIVTWRRKMRYKEDRRVGTC